MDTITGDISIKFIDSKTAKIFSSAIRPETLKNLTDRSKITIRQKDEFLKLKINAKDITAFRATVNSFLIWARVLFSINSLIEPQITS